MGTFTMLSSEGGMSRNFHIYGLMAALSFFAWSFLPLIQYLFCFSGGSKWHWQVNHTEIDIWRTSANFWNSVSFCKGTFSLKQ